MHTTTVRVRYAETDQAGVVYHSNYLQWFEIGRTEYLREMGHTYAAFERERHLLLTVAEALLRYQRPARYDDVIEVGTWVSDLRRVRFRLDHRLRRQADGEVLCTGHIILACVDRAGRPVPLPGDLRSCLAAARDEGVGKTA